ncbi:acyl-CoA thioesterase II [Batrachochytrium dendrobatidis JEL423]|uniref:Acyl-CoA thioesterase II n=1 Tax=Batrachochytrium dendrobatidis (strain JEL423) TaxID=403673 RepID=A0A177WVM2_BATDL|nr:acyl-CoA thioesterase II [Batrachochytrium dendrobatidis JEL423]
MCSFQVEEFSPLAHQYDMPNVPLPESLKSTEQRLREWLEDPRAEKYHKTIQMRLEQMVWMRAIGRLPDGIAFHHCVAAYCSDHELLNTSLIPHGLARLGGHRKLTMLTSLDHAIWFHAPFRADEWLLYVMESPRSIGGRGFAHGRVYTQDGRLVMSTAQEGVVRVNTSPKTDESEPLATGKFTPLKYTVSAKI